MFSSAIAIALCLFKFIQGSIVFQDPITDVSERHGDEHWTRATKLMRRYPMIDGHNALPFS